MIPIKTQTFKMAPLLTLRVPELIEYEKHLQKIGVAVNALETQIGTTLFHVSGDGGTGKTFLLQRLHQHLSGQPNLLVTPIIDLYDIGMHSALDLVDRIAQSLYEQCDDHQKTFFNVYRAEMQKYRAHQVGFAAKEDRNAIVIAFDQACKELTQTHRIVILMDTGELLSYHIDEVQQQLTNFPQFSPDALLRESSRWWLREAIARDTLLPHTLIVLASRKEPSEVYDEFQRLAATDARRIDLDGLSEAGVLEYFAALEKELDAQIKQFKQEMTEETASERLAEIQHNLDVYLDIQEKIQSLDAETRRDIGVVTGRLPVSLALTAQLYLDGSLRDLDALCKEAATDLIGARTKLRNAMVLSLAHYLFGDASEPMQYLALLRKGMTAERLGAVWNAPGEETHDLAACRRVIEFLERQTFVKVIHELSGEVAGETRKMLVLHDEIADWCEDGFFRPNPQRRAKIYARILSRYDEEIKATASRIATDNEARRLHRQLRAERMFYSLRNNPIQGFREYYELAEEAFTASLAPHDAQIHAEFVQWWNRAIAGSPDVYRYREEARRAGVSDALYMADLAKRWVQRFYNQFGRTARATTAQLAEHLIQNLTPPPDQLDRIVLELYRDVARTFTDLSQSEADQIGRDMRTRIEDLQSLLKQAEFNSAESLQTFKARDALAFANYQLGFFESSARAQYDEAIKHYTESIGLYRELRFENNQARSLNDRAYAQAQVGELDDAEFSVRDALSLRESLGFPRPIGLSWNTLGVVLTLSQRPLRAIACCEKALGIFQSLEDERFIMLAMRALAEAHRRRAEGLDDLQEKVGAYKDAITAAESMLVIAEKNAVRHAQMSDLLDEYGCAQRDLAALLHQYPGLGASGEAARLRDAARKSLDRAASIIGRDTAYLRYRTVDSLVNSAYLEYYFGENDLAQSYIDQALEGAPDELKRPSSATFASQRNIFWVLLSKTHALRTRMAGEQLNKMDSLPENQRDQVELRKVRSRFVDAAILALYFAAKLRDVRAAYRSKQNVYDQLRQLSGKELRTLQKAADAASRRMEIPPNMPAELRLSEFIADKFGIRASEED